MELDFVSLSKEFEKYESIYDSLFKKTISHLGIKCDPVVSVSIVDNEFIHKMNNDYRHIDRPTDVISFAFLDNEENKDKILSSPGIVILGDIYISYEKAISQAEEYHHSIEREFSFLFVHGLLHLLGYDHMKKEDEDVMFALQDEILGKKD